jgi:energy-converting hydrogenase Eha subunit C
VATIGFSIALDGGVVRQGAAVVLGLVGVVLVSSPLQQRFAMAASGFGCASGASRESGPA